MSRYRKRTNWGASIRAVMIIMIINHAKRLLADCIFALQRLTWMQRRLRGFEAEPSSCICIASAAAAPALGCQRLSSWAPRSLIKLTSTSQDSENFAAFYISLHWSSTGESRLTQSNLSSYSPFRMFTQRVGFSSGWGYTLRVKENTKSHNWINGTKSTHISFVRSRARSCSSSMHRLWQLQKAAACFLHSFALSLLF